MQSLEDIPGLVGRFQSAMNIKLDKCGGLTEALLMAREGRRLGLRIMVGNMAWHALAMAPALIVGQHSDHRRSRRALVPERDRTPSVVYDRGYIHAPANLWGWTAGTPVG